ncbi:MAG: transporter [Thermodesulfobacteriota bacterium]|nr:transporter [Thermodesulfobacteriota bacterium]
MKVIGKTILIALIAVTGLSTPARAFFKGHHSPGGWGLQSGTQVPTPGGFMVSPLYSRYYSDRLVDENGDEFQLFEGNRDITVNAVGLFGWWVSKWNILGANWGMLGTVAAVDNNISFASFDFDGEFGLTDIYLQPINLGWHLKQADFMVSYGIYFPTGSYEYGADDNNGLGMWTHEFGAGTTLYFDSEKKWHISAMGYLETHSEKKDTDIQVGEILTVEGGLGRSWFEGALSVGIAYYAQWKLTEDEVGLGTTDQVESLLPSGRQVPSSLKLKKSRLYGLGPEINFPIVIKDKLISIVTARYQWEFDARSTLEGQTFNLFINFPFF